MKWASIQGELVVWAGHTTSNIATYNCVAYNVSVPRHVYLGATVILRSCHHLGDLQSLLVWIVPYEYIGYFLWLIDGSKWFKVYISVWTKCHCIVAVTKYQYLKNRMVQMNQCDVHIVCTWNIVSKIDLNFDPGRNWYIPFVNFHISDISHFANTCSLCPTRDD